MRILDLKAEWKLFAILVLIVGVFSCGFILGYMVWFEMENSLLLIIGVGILLFSVSLFIYFYGNDNLTDEQIDVLMQEKQDKYLDASQRCPYGFVIEDGEYLCLTGYPTGEYSFAFGGSNTATGESSDYYNRDSKWLC